MKVCMITYSFYEGDTRVIQYATALAGRGDLVDVVALRQEGDARFEVLQGVNVHRIQERKVNETSQFMYLFRILRFLFASALLLTKNQFSKRYDVIHVHSVPDFLVFAAIVPKLLGARVILDIHDILPEFYASKFGATKQSLLFKSLVWVEKLSIAFSDHVIIANHLWYDRLLSRSVEAGKCSVVINYPDPKIFAPRAKRPADGKFIILYPGSLNHHQGLDVAIGAFARVAEEMPGAEYHIYGEGSTKPALIQLASDLGMADRILFHDALPTEEIAEIMAASDLAVVPKRASSGFGNEAASTKIMEFMSLGVPLIVSNTKIDTFYHDATRVRFFESENEADLGEAMLELWSDPDLRAQLAAGASQYIEQNSWTVRKQDYLALVDGLHRPEQATEPAQSPRENASSAGGAAGAQAVHKTSPR
ncbi:MAG: glycosyltransferase family 4 protein [Acidobacteriia bacterium]|nr:glycosyltransferase family 4 protein [Terriglobia bacterium]